MKTKTKSFTITDQWLQDNRACGAGVEWFHNQEETGLKPELKKVLPALLKDHHFDYANWTVVRFMSHKQKVLYACFAVRGVLKHFEKTYPKDKRPREAIEAAERWAKNPTTANRNAAYAAAYAAANAAFKKKLINYGIKLVYGK